MLTGNNSYRSFRGACCLHIQGLHSMRRQPCTYYLPIDTATYSTTHKLTQHHTNLQPASAVINFIPSINKQSLLYRDTSKLKVHFNVIPYILEGFKPVHHSSKHDPNSRPANDARHIQLLSSFKVYNAAFKPF
jgi:hypothetical protein